MDKVTGFKGIINLKDLVDCNLKELGFSSCREMIERFAECASEEITDYIEFNSKPSEWVDLSEETWLTEKQKNKISEAINRDLSFIKDRSLSLFLGWLCYSLLEYEKKIQEDKKDVIREIIEEIEHYKENKWLED